MEAQKIGFSFSVYSQYLNLTCWKDRGLVWFADNDFGGTTEEFIAAKLNDKDAKIYHGYRKVAINFVEDRTTVYDLSIKQKKSCDIIACVITSPIRKINVALILELILEQNERKAEYFLSFYFNIEYTIRFELAWSEFESYCLNNPEIAFLNFQASRGENVKEKKYETRQLRLELIHTWGKRAMKHYYSKKRKRDSQDFEKRKRQVTSSIHICEYGYLSV